MLVGSYSLSPSWVPVRNSLAVLAWYSIHIVVSHFVSTGWVSLGEIFEVLGFCKGKSSIFGLSRHFGG